MFKVKNKKGINPVASPRPQCASTHYAGPRQSRRGIHLFCRRSFGHESEYTFATLTSLGNKKQGVVLLISVLISSIVLAIGLALANVAYKEQLLSLTQNDSVRAFYAADAGVECVLYWDLHHDDVERGAPNTAGQAIFPENPFPVPGTVYAPYSAPTSNLISCYGQPLGVNFISYAPPTPVWSAALPLTALATSDFIYIDENVGALTPAQKLRTACVQVNVKKTWTDNANGVVEPGEITTEIDSQGYSVCDAASTRRVERTLVQKYCGASSCP
ncbi:MAG: pilus assembly PilX N-terminal domain-containing protein [Patescibacteria group bacterium]